MPSSSLDKKVFATIALVGACIIVTVWVNGLGSFLSYIPATLKPMGGSDQGNHAASPLADFALDQLLETARPIFGPYPSTPSTNTLSTWMSAYSDDTLLVHMNIPGAHDAATWNYSRAARDALRPIVGLVSNVSQPNDWFRCQDISIVGMLDAGIRAFDLRYAQDVTNTTLVFWHGSALQSQTATVEAVMFGFYRWLDDHPSETVLLSFQYEGKKAVRNVDTKEVQMQLYNILTSPAAQQYILQRRDNFGNLGDARGKIILLRRFDLDLLPSSYESSIPGIHFSPKKWTVNSPSIELVYNSSPNPETGEEGTAYIEDYYHPIFLSSSSTLSENVDVKFNAVETHLRAAASGQHEDGLYWAFASGTNTNNEPVAVTPRLMAVGDGDAGPDGVEGVNQRILGLLKDEEVGLRGKRLGIVMFDFFELPGSELVEEFLGLSVSNR